MKEIYLLFYKSVRGGGGAVLPHKKKGKAEAPQHPPSCFRRLCTCLSSYSWSLFCLQKIQKNLQKIWILPVRFDNISAINQV